MITKLILGAFRHSRSQHQSLHKQWIDVSYIMVGKLPDTLVPVAIQQAGDLDMLIRCMEDEFDPKKTSEPDSDHYQHLFSELWIGQCYEICRTLIESGNAPSDNDFDRIAFELRLLRIGIEKHQIAQDNKLVTPLLMKKVPEQEGDKVYEYRKGDPHRGHIMPRSMSSRHSCMWNVIDIAAKKDFWLERRDLAERIVSTFLAQKPKQTTPLA